MLTRPWTRVFAYWLASYRRTYLASVISDFLAPVLFLAALGLGVGGLVGGGGVGGAGSYAQFLAPGLLASQAMQAGVFATLFPAYGAIKWNRQYHAMLASPITVDDVVTGHLAFALARVSAVSVSFTVVAALFGAVAGAGAALAVGAAVLTGASFAAFSVALAASSSSDQNFLVVFRVVVLPLSLFSGAYFPLEQLPGALQVLAWLTPLAHGVALSRHLVLGAVGAVDLVHLAVLVAFVAAGVVLARRRLRVRMVV